MFDAFVGLNSNTILAMQNIEFGSVSSDRYPDPTEMPISKQYQSWISDRRTPIINKTENHEDLCLKIYVLILAISFAT